MRRPSANALCVQPIRTRIFRENQPLVGFIRQHVGALPEGSILAVTSKIAALSQGRTRAVRSQAEKDALIRAESQWAMRTKWTWLTVKDNTVMSSAGIDESNARGKLILLPRDSFGLASSLRRRLMKLYRIRKLGVLITDSRLLPLRAGVVGVAVGYAGFEGVRDYRGMPDLFGRELKMTRADLADSLATAAVLAMGEGAEQQPLALITGAPVRFVSRISRHELEIDPHEDVYAPLFAGIKKIKFSVQFKNGYAVQRHHTHKKRTK